MEFYHIKNNYINYLKQYDNKVPDNKDEKRPYVGIVLEINGVKYYAPLSSPKQKHKKMKNGKDFRKINQGIYGAINFNNMIPVVDCALIKIDIKNLKDLKYKNLLQNQYRYIRNDEEAIKRTAKALRELLITPDAQLKKHDLIIKQRCCNLFILENCMKEYNN